MSVKFDILVNIIIKRLRRSICCRNYVTGYDTGCCHPSDYDEEKHIRTTNASLLLYQSFNNDDHMLINKLFKDEPSLVIHANEIIWIFVKHRKFNIINAEIVRNSKVRLSHRVLVHLFMTKDNSIREYLYRYTITDNFLKIRRFFILHAIKNSDEVALHRMSELKLGLKMQISLRKLVCYNKSIYNERVHLAIKYGCDVTE